MTERILVATDLAESSDAAVREALRIARLEGAEVHLCTALCAPTDPMFFGEEMPADENLAAQIDEAKRALHERATQNGFAAVPHHVHVFDHLPGEEIPRAARRLGCDLIVICSRRLSNSRRFELGSAAERILCNANLPVLVVPPGHGP